MVIFHSYVSLPEGISKWRFYGSDLGQNWMLYSDIQNIYFWKTHEKTLLSLVNQHSYGKPPKCAIFIHFQQNPGTFTVNSPSLSGGTSEWQRSAGRNRAGWWRRSARDEIDRLCTHKMAIFIGGSGDSAVDGMGLSLIQRNHNVLRHAGEIVALMLTMLTPFYMDISWYIYNI